MNAHVCLRDLDTEHALSPSVHPHFLSDSPFPPHPSFVFTVWSSMSSCSWFLFHPLSSGWLLLCVHLCLYTCLHVWDCMYSEASPAPVCQACLEKNYGSPFSGSAKAGRGHGKVVTFGGVTEIEQPIDTVTSSEGEETELLRRLLSKATVAMPTIGLGSQLSERERRYGRGQVQDDWIQSLFALVWAVLRNKQVPLYSITYKIISSNCLLMSFWKSFTFQAYLNE